MVGYVTNTGNTDGNKFSKRCLTEIKYLGVKKEYRRDGGKAGTNYLRPEVSKWDRGPTILNMFLYFSKVQLFVDCTN